VPISADEDPAFALTVIAALLDRATLAAVPAGAADAGPAPALP
jgi:hypothetical protein